MVQLRDYLAFLVDLDGVVLKGEEVITGAINAVGKLKDLGKVLFLTNNSTKSRRGFAKKLLSLGIDAEEGDIINSAFVAARYLKRIAGPAHVFVIGEEGLRKEFIFQGHKLVEPKEAKYIVVGMDRKLTYEKLKSALQALLRGAQCIATNADATYPTPQGLIPGAGCIVGAIRGMGFESKIVGKPSRICMEIAMEVAEVSDPKRYLVIGDRLETDVLGAIRMGMDSALVLTGVSQQKDIMKTGIHPTFVVSRLSDLL